MKNQKPFKPYLKVAKTVKISKDRPHKYKYSIPKTVSNLGQYGTRWYFNLECQLTLNLK